MLLKHTSCLPLLVGLVLGVLSGPAGASPADGLALHLSFDEARGAVLLDEIQAAGSARLEGGARLVSDGVRGLALGLDGNSAFARLYRNPTTSEAYAVSCWFRVAPGGLSRLASANLFTFNRRYQIGFQSSGEQFLLYSYALNVPSYGYGAFEARSDPFPVIEGRWYHVALVLQGSLSFYLDGRNLGTLSGRGSNRGDTEVLVGALNNDVQAGPRYFFPGDVDELRVYGRGLSAGEVVEVMRADAPALAEARLAPSYQVREGQVVIREFQHGRDVERALNAAEVRAWFTSLAPVPVPPASQTEPPTPTTLIEISSGPGGRQDQNVFQRSDQIFLSVRDADFGGLTNGLFSVLIWQAPGASQEVQQLAPMTNQAGVWKAVLPLAAFRPGPAELSIAGMDGQGHPILLRNAQIVLE